MTESPDTQPPRRPRKLPARYATIVQPFILSIFMSFLVSGIATLRTVGLTGEFFGSWMQAWGLSWIVAFPTLLVVMPIVRRVVGLIVEMPPKP